MVFGSGDWGVSSRALERGIECRRMRTWSSLFPRTHDAECFRARSTTPGLSGPRVIRSPVKMRWSVEGLKEVFSRSSVTIVYVLDGAGRALYCS